MVQIAPSARLNQFFRISRLLAGQLDFGSAIRAVAQEVAQIVPHDHLDVCIIGQDGRFHTAYEIGIDTWWGNMPHAPIAASPIRALLEGEVDHILLQDACADPAYRADVAAHRPIFDHGLRSRIHLPMKVHGQLIGALSCSLHQPGRYGTDDVRNARYVAEMLSPYFFALRAADEARQSAIVQTEARAREEGLRQGALRLTEALEQERQRIGMDLHDQTLADLTRLTRRLERLQTTDPVSATDLAPVAQGLQQAMQDLRQIIETAKPSVLHLFGFAQAVENHLDRAIRDSGQTVRGSLSDGSDGLIDRLDPTVGMALFRITQEAVNNAVHHAQAARVHVDLRRVRGQLAIVVEDDGIGLTGKRFRSGSGIENMKTRARLISARFQMSAGAAGTGARVAISLPAAAQDRRRAQ
ncbi:MAG: GAF domain-containing sensor histidine kinase [Pseudorhodobacter sp.]